MGIFNFIQVDKYPSRTLMVHNVLVPVVTVLAHCVIIYHCMIKLIDHPCMSLYSCHFRNGKLDIVKYIVKNSEANNDAKDKWDRTPLDLARE